MKFRSRNKDTVRLASTVGDVVLIGEDMVEVPEHMEGDAYSKGCISEEMVNTIKDEMDDKTNPPVVDPPVVGTPVDLSFAVETEVGAENAKIKEEIDKMIDEPEDSFFTSQGFPNLSVLSGKCGFTVPKVRMTPVWEFIQAERDAKEGE